MSDYNIDSNIFECEEARLLLTSQNTNKPKGASTQNDDIINLLDDIKAHVEELDRAIQLQENYSENQNCLTDILDHISDLENMLRAHVIELEPRFQDLQIQVNHIKNTINFIVQPKLIEKIDSIYEFSSEYNKALKKIAIEIGNITDYLRTECVQHNQINTLQNVFYEKFDDVNEQIKLLHSSLFKLLNDENTKLDLEMKELRQSFGLLTQRIQTSNDNSSSQISTSILSESVQTQNLQKKQFNYLFISIGLAFILLILIQFGLTFIFQKTSHSHEVDISSIQSQITTLSLSNNLAIQNLNDSYSKIENKQNQGLEAIERISLENQNINNTLLNLNSIINTTNQSIIRNQPAENPDPEKIQR